MFGVDEVKFGGREGERFPVKPAFQQKRATSVFGTLEAFLEFVLQPCELFRREAALSRGIDERAGRAGGVSAELSRIRAEQGLVPFGRLIVGINCGAGGFDG